MLRHLVLLIQYLLFFSFNQFNTDEIKKEYTIKPVFYKNMSWKQTVKASINFKTGGKSYKQTFDFTMAAKITVCKNNIPSKIEYYNVNGKQIFYKNSVEKESYDNKDGKIIADIDENFYLKNAKDIGRLSDDILLVFPAGSFIGFIPPNKKIKQGTKWSSAKLIPFGPKTLKKQKNELIKIEGEFKVVKIKQKKATILWKGTALDEINNVNVSWKKVIEYDLKHQRFNNNTGYVKIYDSETEYIYQLDVIASY